MAFCHRSDQLAAPQHYHTMKFTIAIICIVGLAVLLMTNASVSARKSGKATPVDGKKWFYPKNSAPKQIDRTRRAAAADDPVTVTKQRYQSDENGGYVHE